MEWTDSQREAIETRGRRVIVSAGAGSGKTRVLVERYLRLLEENPTWRVSDIVAVTFTEKAAREMVSRIRREIRTRIAQSDSPAVRERWRMHRNAIDSARIGTIHALCASILRAHPAEAGIDPAFEVIEEIEAAHLLEQAIEAAIDEAAINRPTTDDRSPTARREAHPAPSGPRPLAPDHRPPPPAPQPLNLLQVFAYLSPNDTQSALTALIAQGDRVRSAMTRLTDKSADDIFTLWQTTLDRLRGDAARALLEREAWLCAVQTVTRTAALDATDKIEQCRAQVAGLLAEIDSSLRASADDQITRALLDMAAGVNLVGGSKKKWPSEDALKAVKEALRQLREAVRDEELLALEMNEADRAAAEVTARLVRLYERARHRFAWLKQQRSMLDFNDLEEITERMLARHLEVCARYTDPARGLIRGLMVDEFQDTAPIQKRILWMLAPHTDEMFIIGDAKQSIYRFRGADVTVFHDVRDDLKRSGGHDVPMDVCFRTHTRLISFVNHLFPAIFTRESRYDTPYEAMSARRQSSHSSPSVELHIITQSKEAENKLNTAALREIEARG
jgi:ATP-dependent helicase/nuclease subunit A